jgi:hypothetical protein
MASVIYNSFKRDIMNGSIDLDTDTIKCALVTSSYTPDQDAHDNYDDITNEVANGNGYTTGGQALANKAVTADNTDNEGVFDADDVTWSASTITARGAVLYKDTGTPSSSKLICYVDFLADYSSNNGNFTIQWASEGILNLN